MTSEFISSRRRHAEIAGAGFAGLAAAIALAQRGWSVRVHEANEELRELGAGIFMWDNGLAALDALGVLDEVLATSVAAPATEVWVDGKRRSSQPANTAQMFAMRTMARQNLYAAVLAGARRQGVEIVTGSPAAGAHPDGYLVLANGQRCQADLVIGADGAGSRVRDSMPVDGKTQRVAFDKGIIRVLVDRTGFQSGDWENVVDLWSHVPITRRILVVPCDEKTIYLALMASKSDAAGSRVPIDAETWSSAFPMLKPLLERVGCAGKYDIYQSTRISSWHSGRVVLIGDAAHAMPPTLGQGAGMAMVNALALAVALDRTSSVPDALRQWEASERPFTDLTQERAEELAALGPERSDKPKGEVGLHGARSTPTGTFLAPAPEPNAHIQEIADAPWYRAAWALVLRRHAGKLDKLGRPAEEHFTRVANRLISFFPQANPAQIQAALLHDALEPGAFTAEDLRGAGISERAISVIQKISLPQDGRSYIQYSQDLAATGDVEALQVKLADNADAFELFATIGTAEAKLRIEQQYVPSRRIMRAGLPARLRAQIAE